MLLMQMSLKVNRESHRHYAQRHLAGFIRISVGKPEQTDKLMSALRQL